MQVMRLLVSGQLDHKTASLLLYALQTASTNLRMTRFSPSSNDVILDVRDVAQTALNEQIWDDEDFDDPEDSDDYEEETEEEEAEAEEDVEVEEEEEEEDDDEAPAIVAPKPAPKPAPAVQPVAKVTATGSAVLSPPAKKPVVKATTAKEAGQQVADHIRKTLFPAGLRKPDRSSRS